MEGAGMTNFKGAQAGKPRPPKPGTLAPAERLEQRFRIKRLLAEKGETAASLARRLNLPAGTVDSTIGGHRQNREVREKIAGFLGLPVAQLFRDNGREHGDIVPEKNGAGKPKNKPLKEKGFFFFLRRVLAKGGQFCQRFKGA